MRQEERPLLRCGPAPHEGVKRRPARTGEDFSAGHLLLEPDRRNKVLLRLLYIAGLRVSEIADLKWRDLQPRTDGGQVTVFGKGSKTRTMLLPSPIWRELLRFRHHADLDTPVFASRRGGGHLHPTAIERIVWKAAQRAGVEWEGFAALAAPLRRDARARARAPIHLVQATLGHTSVATTGRYCMHCQRIRRHAIWRCKPRFRRS